MSRVEMTLLWVVNGATLLWAVIADGATMSRLEMTLLWVGQWHGSAMDLWWLMVQLTGGRLAGLCGESAVKRTDIW